MATIPTYPDLAGKAALVTGATGDIGAETARWLARNGVHLALRSRNAGSLAPAIAELKGLGVDALAVEADATDAAALEQARDATEARLGPIELLFAFAGGGVVRPSPLEDMAEADWRAVVDTNLLATFLTLRTFLPGMKARHAGSIVTMGRPPAALRRRVRRPMMPPRRASSC